MVRSVQIQEHESVNAYNLVKHFYSNIHPTGTSSSQGGAASQDGTKESLECANRGLCNRDTGACTCMSGYRSSDGAANSGLIGDCGFHDGITSLACPLGTNGDTCSGHGTCLGVSDNYICTCDSPWIGPDCSEMECPRGRAWFDEASSIDIAHADEVECSNSGLCNRKNGRCDFDFRFEGDACERLKCPTKDSVFPCGGREGTCMTLSDLAPLTVSASGVPTPMTYGVDDTASSWDHSTVQGCVCESPEFDSLSER